MSELSEHQLLHRKWKSIGTKRSSDGEQRNPFVFMTWNHLADGLDVNGGFDTPVEHLRWEFRQPKIIQEIKDTNPDIFCLQEANHSTDVLAKEFT